MRVFAHPLRLTSGAVATVEQGSPVHARQVAAAIVSTVLGERPLAPDLGIFDPTVVGTSAAEVVGAVTLAEPDLTVTGVDISTSGDRQRVDVSVRWAEIDEEA